MVNNDIVKEVINKKRDEGLSFSEIAEYLKLEYGIERSRQAVYGLYTRSKKKKSIDIDSEKKIDIVNLYALGYTRNRIQSELGVSAYKINKLLDTTKELSSIRIVKVQEVFNMLANNKDINEIKEALKYKQYEVPESGLKILVSEAIVLLLEKQINNSVGKLRSLGVSAETVQRSVGELKEKYSIPAILLRDKCDE